MWFTVTGIKHFKSGVLRTITNIVKKEYTLFGKLKKKKKRQSLKILFIMWNNSVKCEFLHWYFSRILLIDLELDILNMDFFDSRFQEFCW